MIIISDRKVIDKQLKDAVKQFEKTLGVVVWAEKSSKLKEALETGKNIAKINESGGTQFTKDDEVKLRRLGNTIFNNENFRESIKTNTESNLKLLFRKLFDDVMADMYENDLNFYKKIEGNPSVRELIKENLFEDVFKRGRELNL